MTAPRHARRPRKRSGWQRAVIGLNLVASLSCMALAGAITWSWQRVREIPRIELGTELSSSEVGAGPAGSAQNILVVGTDSADGLPEDDPVLIGRDNGQRTDTLMVVRLDPAAEQAALLSIPRDLYVRIAGTRGSSRINNAFQGGPGRLVDTITDNLDIPIHHYVELDFAGFRDLVEAIDGVPVYFPTPARDNNSGLYVPDPGCVTLDPVQALAYARSRYYQYQDEDGDWHYDPTGDLGRISRQQDFIRRALHRAFQRGARNPGVLADLVGVGTRAITIDGDLTPGDLLDLGNRFRTFDPSNLATYSLPVVDARIGGAAVLRLDTTRAQDTLDVFRGVDPARVAPDNTVVLVQNGTGQSGLGEEAAQALRALDFVVPPDSVGDAETFDVEQTTVLYIEGAEERALLLARALNALPVVEEGDYIVGADVTLVLGADWPGVVAELPADAVAAPGSESGGDDGSTTTTGDDEAAAGETTPTTEPEATTTTRRLGEVPEAPEGTDC